MSDPRKLIAAYLDDALSDAERDELVAWLKAHPDHLRAFVEANHFEQQIRQAVHGQVQREAAMHLVESGDSAPAETAPDRRSNPPSVVLPLVAPPGDGRRRGAGHGIGGLSCGAGGWDSPFGSSVLPPGKPPAPPWPC